MHVSRSHHSAEVEGFEAPEEESKELSAARPGPSIGPARFARCVTAGLRTTGFRKAHKCFIQLQYLVNLLLCYTLETKHS